MAGGALTELLQEHVIAALLKQERFHAAIGEVERWEADVEAGTLRLDDRTYDVGVVGTESLKARTFVWGAGAGALRRLGEERGVAELLDDREIPVATLSAGTAAMIALGVADLDAYFLGVAGERGVAFTIRDAALRSAPVPLEHLPSSFLEVAEVAAFSHRRAFAHYCARPLPEVPATVEGGRAVLRAPDATLSVAFDREGRAADFRLEAPRSV